MDRRRIGKSDVVVSPIGLGAFKVGRNEKVKYAQSYAMPSDGEVERLVNGVIDAGINLVDTAPAYGTSEERIGKALGRRRSEVVLCTKVGETFEHGESRYDFSKAAVTASVERSLARLRTECVEVLLIHSDGQDMKVLRESDAVEAVLRMKDRGAARLVGLSGKTVEGARAALVWADVIMVEYHTEDVSHKAVMREAGERGVGVLVKKGLASGRLAAGAAIPFVLRESVVASLVIGSLSVDRMRENAEIASGI